jgi:hypothetical protein
MYVNGKMIPVNYSRNGGGVVKENGGRTKFNCDTL